MLVQSKRVCLVARGPGFSQLVLALRKSFQLGESMHLSLEAEAFNLLNHANFAKGVGRFDPVLIKPRG
jgi:hypothetical protein